MKPNNIRYGASAVIFKNRQVLLIRRAAGAFSGLWSVPGGHVLEGEHPKDAAVREVKEETGVLVEVEGLVDQITVRPEVDITYQISVFYGNWISGEPVAASDATDAKWVLPAEINDFATTEGLPEIIAAVAARLQKRL